MGRRAPATGSEGRVAHIARHLGGSACAWSCRPVPGTRRVRRAADRQARFIRSEGQPLEALTAIGAFERVTLGFFEVASKEYKRIPVDEQVELLSLVGNIAQDDRGTPKVHAHVVVGKSDGTAHGGHLLEAHVRPTLEVIVVESAKHLCRKTHPDLGVALLDLAQ
jgi:predicted DNA-binding protein with PD1-like motif